ncbi:MAG: ATP-binding protein [Spirochaetales bacterium]
MDLQKAQRIESLGVLAGGIAHDFNNLMAGLLSNTELAQYYLGEGNVESAVERLSKTPSIFARGKALTRRLLTFSNGGAPVRLPTALGPLLAEWVEFALLGADVTAELQIDPALRSCDCDVGQISQVLNNLLINARQASPDGSVIQVSAHNVHKLGEFVALSVANPGPPIPPEVQARMFDPFFTTKALGSGLGLSIAYSIVRQHNGRIEVVSEKEKGTTVTVFLPALAAAAPSEGPEPVVEGYQGIGTALLMDDSEELRDGLGVMLETLGYQVLLASRGEEALEVFLARKNAGLTVEVFLLDNKIPGGLGGVETAHRLRQAGCTAPILLMSGIFDETLSPRWAGQDGLWQLAKPFRIEELMRVLASLSPTDGR